MRPSGLPARILIVALAVQSAAFYAIASRREFVPDVPPLAVFPPAVSGWTAARDFPPEKEVQDVLRADDILNRVYVDAAQTTSAALFVAFFKTQRYGQSPHSPKNCLPGSGWEPLEEARLPIEVPGRSAPMVVHKYVIARGDDKSVVLYWYQSHGRVIAGEMAAKFWLVADAIRTRRSDTALVRVIVRATGGDTARAQRTAEDFVRSMYPELARHLPA